LRSNIGQFHSDIVSAQDDDARRLFGAVDILGPLIRWAPTGGQRHEYSSVVYCTE